MTSKQRENTVLHQQISQAEANIQKHREWRRNETYSKEVCDDRIAKETQRIEALQNQIKENRQKIRDFRDYTDIIRANARGPEALQKKLEAIAKKNNSSRT